MSSVPYVIGVISYFPDDPSVRIKRKQAHEKQMRWLNDMWPSVDVVQISQNYTRDEEKEAEIALGNGIRRFTQITGPKLGMSGARNRVLDAFYSSDYEYLALMDDDVTVFPYYDAHRFLHDLCLYQHPEEVGMVRPLVPSMVPFKKSNWNARKEVRSFWILRSSMSINPSGVNILGNFRKRFGKSVYFREDMDPSKGEGYEDYDFVLRLRELKIPCHLCQQLVSNPVASDFSVALPGDARQSMHVKNLTSTYDAHPSLRISYSTQSGKLKSDVSKLSTWPKLYVPRSRPYEIQGRLVPKNTHMCLTKKRLV